MISDEFALLANEDKKTPLEKKQAVFFCRYFIRQNSAE